MEGEGYLVVGTRTDVNALVFLEQAGPSRLGLQRLG